MPFSVHLPFQKERNSRFLFVLPNWKLEKIKTLFQKSMNTFEDGTLGPCDAGTGKKGDKKNLFFSLLNKKNSMKNYHRISR